MYKFVVNHSPSKMDMTPKYTFFTKFSPVYVFESKEARCQPVNMSDNFTRQLKKLSTILKFAVSSWLKRVLTLSHHLL